MTAAEFESAVGSPLEEYAFQCHAASIELVRSGALGPSRVARGTCPRVGGQHSWVVLGTDCYDPAATVVDATLWSYDASVSGVWTGLASKLPHDPFGSGSIWTWGKPVHQGGETIEIEADWSEDARRFLAMLGPLDRGGWSNLAHAPVGGWPAAEIIAAMHEHPKIGALIPIDIVGMVTDLNPAGLYLALPPATVLAGV